jgi:hypothetical protein
MLLVNIQLFLKRRGEARASWMLFLIVLTMISGCKEKNDEFSKRSSEAQEEVKEIYILPARETEQLSNDDNRLVEEYQNSEAIKKNSAEIQWKISSGECNTSVDAGKE